MAFGGDPNNGEQRAAAVASSASGKFHDGGSDHVGGEGGAGTARHHVRCVVLRCTIRYAPIANFVTLWKWKDRRNQLQSPDHISSHEWTTLPLMVMRLVEVVLVSFLCDCLAWRLNICFVAPKPR